VNILYTTVVLCAPGSTTNCQTIDHVQVDTGSYGLRLISDALQPSLVAALPAAMSGGQALAECTMFADGYSWGPLRMADVQIAGEKASGLEVQVIGDPTYSTVPQNCSSSGGNQEDTVPLFGANGILGVGPFAQDCGTRCVTGTVGFYYVCASPTSCTESTVALAQQIGNPVVSFTNSSNAVQDNNGVIIELSQIAVGGAPTVSGSLVFGIDTEPNNAMTATNVLPGDPSTGEIITVYNSQTLSKSYIDSGSNALYFVDGSFKACVNNVGFYCPPALTQRTAVNEGTGGTPQSTVNFSVANADSLNAANAAFDNLAGCPVSSSGPSSQCPTSGQTFDWGLPFYFGLDVYTAIACNDAGAGCKTTSKGFGPYFAY